MNRVAQRLKRTPAEMELDEEFQKAANDFIEYIDLYTNIPAIASPNAEADDVIATYIFDRPNEDHIIVSSDSDFHQLITHNVKMFDAMKGHIITIEGVFDDRMKPVIDNKTRKQKEIGNPEWILFKKCIRGDTSDNIASAYPMLREKSTKNKVGMIDCFEDRQSRGFEWNTVMLHEWEDHKGNVNKVKDMYERNKLLIDLSMIPDFIVDEIRESIDAAVTKRVENSAIGFKFMKFCSRYELVNISNSPQPYLDFLGRNYE
jgi:5'-3' exonuclease